MSDQLLVLPEYKMLTSLLSGAADSTTGISDKEIQHLCWLGRQVPNGGYVVDVGSHRGKSVCAIGAGCLSSNIRFKIYAIDLWTLGKEKTYEHQYTEETWRIFNEQVAKMGLTDYVIPCMDSSVKAASKRRNPIHLLFIDASHKYLNVLDDYNVWSRFVPSGGYIAFHDYGTRFTGVQKVIDQTVITSGLWKDSHQYGSIWSAQRV